MRNRLLKLMLVIVAAAGVVVAWQRRNETSPTPPRSASRPAEPFMDPVDPPRPAPSVEASHIDAAVGPPDAAAPTAPLPQPPHDAFTRAPAGSADDLKRITGIGPKLEQMLNDQAITTYAQLAALDDAEIDRLQTRLPGFPGRIRRDGWVAQAARLMQG